jgi:hypothetical protein
MPHVAWNPSGGRYLVVWSAEDASSGFDVWARAFDGEGTAAADASLVFQESYGQLNPRSAADERGLGFLVVWEDHRDSFGDDADIYVRPVDWDGVAAGSEQVLASTGGQYRQWPAIAFSAFAGEHAVVWDYAEQWDNHQVVRRRVGRDGAPLETAATIAGDSHNEGHPSVAADGCGGFLYVWEDDRDQTTTGTDLYADSVQLDVLEGHVFEGSPPETDTPLTGVAVDLYCSNSPPTPESLVSTDTTDSSGVFGLAPAGTCSAFLLVESDPELYRSTDAASDGGLVIDSNTLQHAPPGPSSLLAGNDFWDVPLAFVGQVFEGPLGDTSTPLAEATVTLYCSATEGDLGTVLTSTQSDFNGFYELQVPQACSYYSIVETDPDGYQSTGAASVGGAVVNDNTIRYASPIGALSLEENNFFDEVAPSAPGGWTAFGPTGWQGNQTLTCTVTVEDTTTGLDITTAAYSYSSDSGQSWSAWLPASCGGTQGTTAPEVITAVDVPFAVDSPSSEAQIRFRIDNMAGITGVSGMYSPLIDTTPPDLPTSFTSTLDPWDWHATTAVTIDWADATDDGCGVSGYSYEWSGSETTLPDAVYDGSASELATNIPGEGEWSFHIRVVDQVGNWSVDAYHINGFRQDATPPGAPPGLSCDPSGVWSNDSRIDCSWNDASDPVGSVAGYSLLWDHSPSTVPDTIVDEDIFNSADAEVVDGTWYFHVRSVDEAGHGSTTVHGGPFLIDATRPVCVISPLSAVQDSTSFAVSWSADPAGGSPMADYDVSATAYYGGSVVDLWSMIGTTGTSTSFQAERGRRYVFKCNANDTAGNYGLDGPSVETTVGRTVSVHVQDQGGTALSGARVFRGQNLVGTTNLSGNVSVPETLRGDRFSALYQVHEEPTARDNHDQGSTRDWRWRVHLTSFGLDGNGEPDLHEVQDLYQVQMLTVRRDQALIGKHLLVSVEWDASHAYLEELKNGLYNASTYLYDNGDSQLFFERVDIVDGATYWNDADLRVFASNRQWPCAHVWGINGTTGYIHMGRQFNGSSSSTGPWTGRAAYSMFTHEWGHYGLGLLDEYLDRDGKNVPEAYCASNYHAQPDESRRASLMNHQYDSTEMCSRVDPNHQHRTNTHHDRVHGESIWETVKRRFTDPISPDRWRLKTPDDRGAVMAGPSSIPVPDWVVTDVTDNVTGVCDPFELTTVIDSVARAGVDVYVKRPGRSPLYQGRSDANGKITVLGAKHGQTIELRLVLLKLLGRPFAWWSQTTTASCPRAAEPLDRQVDLEPEPYLVSVHVRPAGASTVQLTVSASAPLDGLPQVEIWQSGAADPVVPELAFSAGQTVAAGTAALDADLPLAGTVHTTTFDVEDQRVEDLTRFQATQVIASELSPMVLSEDGDVHLVLEPDALSADAWLSIAPTAVPGEPLRSYTWFSPAYEISASTGQMALGVPAPLHIRYHDDSSERIPTDSLRVFQYDGTGRWIELESTVDTEQQQVSATISSLGTFALLGETGRFSCDVNGDAECSAADLSAELLRIADPLHPIDGDPDVDGSGGVDAADQAALAPMLLSVPVPFVESSVR